MASVTSSSSNSATTSTSGSETPASSPDVGTVASTPAEREEAVRPAQFGRVAGVAVWTDGSLLIAEDQSGVIYRVVASK